jgi:hypothetical protein
MPQTPDEMMSAVTGSLAGRTGRSLEQWLALVRSSEMDPPDGQYQRLEIVTHEADKHRGMFA